MKQMLDSERVPVLRKRIGVHVRYIRTLEDRRAKDRERIKALEAALAAAENRAVLHSSDAALLNANNDRIFAICRKALRETGE